MAQVSYTDSSGFQQLTLSPQEIRQIVRDLDRAARIQIAYLNRIHADPTGPGRSVTLADGNMVQI